MQFKRLLGSISFLLIGLAAISYAWTEMSAPYPQVLTGTRLTAQKTLVQDVAQLEKKSELISLPPITSKSSAGDNVLVSSLIIEATNGHRLDNSISPLKENSLLTSSASNKVKDMFANQYFAHESPTGTDVGELIEASGYAYILVGENLAEGRFKDSADVVLAWMNSPGHRANILNHRFTEIGVAVGRGLWNGRDTWMAVQEFGLPLSVCDAPNTKLHDAIEANKASLTLLKGDLDLLRAEIETSSPGDWSSFNRKVKDYNSIVIEYNALIEETQLFIKVYNQKVELFNECLKEVTN